MAASGSGFSDDGEEKEESFIVSEPGTTSAHRQRPAHSPATQIMNRSRVAGTPDSVTQSLPAGLSADVEQTSRQTEDEFVYVTAKPENQLEAQRQANNYMFGLIKWKSHITARPLQARSEIVQRLYSDEEEKLARTASTINAGNVLYACLIGWWLAVIYCLVGLVMAATIVGRHYCPFCFKLAEYFLWPFGQFVRKESCGRDHSVGEAQPLISMGVTDPMNHKHTRYWHRVSTYVWLILGLPLLVIVHVIIFSVTWFLVVSIPVSKVNLKTIKRVLLLPPETLEVEPFSLDNKRPSGDIIMFTQQAVNVYYYKYTVDGMNVILVNLLSFVILALVLGYADSGNAVTSSETKFILSLLAIIPLAYYIGMAITSLSAQSNFAIGAVLNATFGSIVEIALYVTALLKGYDLNKSDCYNDLVKSALAGTLMGTLLFIPGICMILGGLKHRTQRFNHNSAGVSSTLLFAAVAGVFAPTIFARIYGTLECQKCVYNVTANMVKELGNTSFDMRCIMCQYSVFGLGSDDTFYINKIRPMVYACAIVLPLTYCVGLVYSLKTHSKDVYGKFIRESKKHAHDTGHTIAHWSKLKSFFILLLSTMTMSLSANLVTSHIQPILQSSGISVNFIGVTLLALVPDIPEIVNGIQFALQNNITLSIEIGTTIAIQVCMVQFPILVLVDIIHPLEFYMVFSDLLLWSVIFSVLVINYIFQDGKSDYLQGTALCVIYLILIMMYYFTPVSPGSEC